MKEIIFTSPYDLHLVEETCIQPAKNFIPEHWKNLTYYKDNKSNLKGYNKTAKACPSFAEIFKEGYVLPSPCDIWLYTDGEDWKWETATPVDFIDISHHAGFQYFNSVPDTNVKMVFKLDTDKLHELNPQIAFTSTKNEIVINKGTPLCYYVPFKREKYKYSIVEHDKLKKKLLADKLNYPGGFNKKNYMLKDKDER